MSKSDSTVAQVITKVESPIEKIDRLEREIKALKDGPWEDEKKRQEFEALLEKEKKAEAAELEARPEIQRMVAEEKEYQQKIEKIDAALEKKGASSEKAVKLQDEKFYKDNVGTPNTDAPIHQELAKKDIKVDEVLKLQQEKAGLEKEKERGVSTRQDLETKKDSILLLAKSDLERSGKNNSVWQEYSKLKKKLKEANSKLDQEWHIPKDEEIREVKATQPAQKKSLKDRFSAFISSSKTEVQTQAPGGVTSDAKTAQGKPRSKTI